MADTGMQQGSTKPRNRFPQDLAFLVVLMLALVLFWLHAVVGVPLAFWSPQHDWPVMPLAEAINIDFWLREFGQRTLSQAQFYQPGMWFQLTSYGLYRLVGGSGSPVELFESIIRDPSRYWFALQLAPLLMTGFALTMLWRQTIGLAPQARCAALGSYFVAAAAMLYAVWGFFNESFTLALAVLFFPMALDLLRAGKSRPILRAALVGLATSGLYMHKMNYVVWGLAVIPALGASAWTGRISLFDAAVRSAAILTGLVFGVLAVGYLFLGPLGLRLMLESHLQIILGSGIYGSGEKTLVSLSTLLTSALAMAKAEPLMLLSLSLMVIVALWLAFKHRHDTGWLRQHLPEGLFLLAAAGVMLLALLKHYQSYYVVSVAAVFPFLVIWLAKAGARRSLIAILLVSLTGMASGAYTTSQTRLAWAESEARMRADDAILASIPIPPGSVRLWMYQTHNDIAGRVFMLSFTGLDNLLANVVTVQGPNYFISPWHTNIATLDGARDLADIRWQLIVVDKDWLRWINRSLHTWIDDPKIKRTEMQQVVIFERQ